MTGKETRLPTPEEFEAALATVRQGRNPERTDLVPRQVPADPTVPAFLLEFEEDVFRATKKAARAYLDWRERGDKPPAGRRRTHV